jgi:DNA-binding protein HU-beta
LNRRELVNAIASHVESEPREVDKVLRGFVDVVSATMAKGEQVSIPGFAKFVRRDRPARMGRNPATGEQIKIKASRKAAITPLKALKDTVMGTTPAPKLGKVAAAPAKSAPARKSAAKKAPAKKAGAAKKATKKR